MPTDRASYAGMPPAAFNQRNRIAQTMMNIGSPPPQAVPPQYAGLGMRMGANLAHPLYGTEEAGPSSFMGGRAPPMPQQQMPQQAPPAPPMPPPMQQAPPPPVDPSSLFAAPPAIPGQPPPEFAKPPVF